MTYPIIYGSHYLVSEKIVDFVGEREVAAMTPEGVTLKNGEFIKFPEPAVRLPVPDWVKGLNWGGDQLQTGEDGEWEFLSFAKERAKAFSAELEQKFQ